MESLIGFVQALREAGIFHRIESHRDAMMIVVPTPMEYYEIEFFADGRLEYQRFGPAGDVYEDSAESLLARIVDDLTA